LGKREKQPPDERRERKDRTFTKSSAKLRKIKRQTGLVLTSTDRPSARRKGPGLGGWTSLSQGCIGLKQEMAINPKRAKETIRDLVGLSGGAADLLDKKMRW